MKKVKFSLKKDFYESLYFIKELKNYFIFSISLFIMAGIIGFFFSPYLSFIDEIIKGLISKTTGLTTLELIVFIFKNNLQAALLSFILGIMIAIFPVVTCFFNGLLLGYVLNRVWLLSGFSDFWRILPHGIFELPAIIIAIALGIRLGFSPFLYRKGHGFKETIYKGIKTFLLIVVPLLVIAAIIEGLLISFIN